MTVAARPLFELDDSFARELEGLHQPWQAEPVPAPSLLVLNEGLARGLGLDPAALRSPAGVDLLAGNAAPEGVTTVAQAYAGHQFGGYSPRLGDGRALLLGEIVDADGVRRDLHLKGSGRTPFARGGDGRAAVGPMLREYLMGEAMHALEVPTTRMLAVVATGDTIVREVESRHAEVPGAVMTRVAASHLRVGTFQFAAATGDRDLLRSLTDYAIARHAPEASGADNPAMALFEHVIRVQADLVAQWMLLGFIHGVLNTDNVTISGETIDYGPCAFMDAYDPATVFSSIDHGGRYAYGNQPAITTWNLARLAEAMLPLFDDDTDTAVATATGVLESFPERLQSQWTAGMRAKLGLRVDDAASDHLIAELLEIMNGHGVDYTGGLRSLSSVARGDIDAPRIVFGDAAMPALSEWLGRWAPAVGGSPGDMADAMDRVNPAYVPRNHLVEAALTSASWGDFGPFDDLLDAVTRPFERRDGLERFEQPAPDPSGYRTFCGT
jgi:uncharacterized protein YdiU (UPF0061 family)